MVPNLGYAYQKGYVKTSGGYASSRITLIVSMKQLTNAHKGVREQKNVGNGNRCFKLNNLYPTALKNTKITYYYGSLDFMNE